MAAGTLSPRLIQAVQERLSRGGYGSEEELLWAALNALDDRDAVDESIKAGLDDMVAGRVQPVEGLADRIREQARVNRGG